MNTRLRFSLAGASLLVALLLVVAGLQQPTPVHAAGSSKTDARAAGAVLFHEKGCEQCHGVDGIGVADRGPDLSLVGKRLKKEAIEHQIHDGGGGMPAFGDILQPDEVQQLVEFLAAKKKPAMSRPAVAPPPA